MLVIFETVHLFLISSILVLFSHFYFSLVFNPQHSSYELFFPYRYFRITRKLLNTYLFITYGSKWAMHGCMNVIIIINHVVIFNSYWREKEVGCVCVCVQYSYTHTRAYTYTQTLSHCVRLFTTLFARKLLEELSKHPSKMSTGEIITSNQRKNITISEKKSNSNSTSSLCEHIEKELS